MTDSCKDESINEWTCEELQKWIISIKLGSINQKKAIKAIQDQQINGQDFASITTVSDIINAFPELNRMSQNKIFARLRTITPIPPNSINKQHKNSQLIINNNSQQNKINALFTINDVKNIISKHTKISLAIDELVKKLPFTTETNQTIAQHMITDLMKNNQDIKLDDDDVADIENIIDGFSNDELKAMEMTLISDEKNNDSNDSKCMTYTWNMNQKQIQWIKTSTLGSEFVSNPFIIYDNIKCALSFYPNGTDEDTKGECSLYLRLLQLPPKTDKLVLDINVKCRAFNIIYSEIEDISYEDDRCTISLPISFDQIQQHDFSNDELNNVFEVNISVLKTYNKILADDGMDNFHKFEWKLSKDELTYFVNTKDAKLSKFEFNADGVDWELRLESRTALDNDNNEIQYKNINMSEFAHFIIHTNSVNTVNARVMIYCEQVLFGGVRHEEFSNQYNYGFAANILNKNRFKTIHDEVDVDTVTVTGFVQLCEDNSEGQMLQPTNNDIISELYGVLQHQWSITDKQLQVFINCKKDEVFFSEPFKLAGCSWALFCRPKNDGERVSVYVKLLELPMTVKGLVVRLTWKVNETLSESSFIQKLTYNKDSIGCTLMSTKQLISLNSFTINFNIEIITCYNQINKVINLFEIDEKKK
eukprot:226291_1